ncbi:MAG: aminotransferase class III-fold pyridoxal phosphate-dependent enzyme, partial [Clostridia bacterium]|nr:aminotransferase class III-fold pyridoxal phosphate-dependent enzyme [Clostridia bacterium]
MSNVKQIDQQYVAGTYARFPVEIVSGKGSLVYDENGKEYIDMGSGIGVTGFGIADDAWVAAVTAQLAKVQHMSNLYYTEPCALLAQELCNRTGMKKVFFANSGAEANECAIKVARKYAADKKGPEYSTIVTLKNSFHGRTLTTLSATGQEHYHELFQPLTPGFVHGDAGDLEGIKELALNSKAAGILIECVQGEGGVIAMEPDFVKGLAAFCQEQDILFMVDEVQTGNGRTGELYAYMNYGVQPDVVSTAKGLGGGLPLGAALLSEKVQNVLGFGDHGSTFGGNPVCCAGALSILRRIDDALLADVKKKGEYIRQQLEGAKGIKGISGMG